MPGGDNMNIIKMFEPGPPIDICVVGCGGAGIATLREVNAEHTHMKKVAINLCPGGSLLSAQAHNKVYLSERNMEDYNADDVYHLAIANYGKITEAIGAPDIIIVICALKGRTGLGTAKALKKIYEDKLVLVLGYLPFCFEGSFNANKAIEYIGDGNIWLIDNQMIANLCPSQKFVKVLKIANQMANAFVEHIASGFTKKSIDVLKKHPVKGKADMGMGTSLLQALNDINGERAKCAFVSVKVPEKDAFRVEHFARYLEETQTIATEKLLISSFSGYRTEILTVREY
jgi:cell division GTPase FtsZ